MQIKRVHEYKRQLLNILETIALYQAIKAEPGRDWAPRVKILAGKAAASYRRAKLIIKLAHDVARVVNADPDVAGRLKLVVPAQLQCEPCGGDHSGGGPLRADLHGGPGSLGTGNMKLALNGALTIGTLDGANVEIRDRVGADNIFIFGLTAEEVAARTRGHAMRRRCDCPVAAARRCDRQPDLGSLFAGRAEPVPGACRSAGLR